MITLVNYFAQRVTRLWTVWAVFAALMFAATLTAQSHDEPSQETINKRIEEIFKTDLSVGTTTSPEGYRITMGKVYYSKDDAAEVKKFGDKAITPLAAYFDHSDIRAQELAIRFLGVIGGPRVLKILSEVVEKSASEGIRYRVLLTLTQYSWPEIAAVVHRVATNDQSTFVRSEAQKLVDKNDQPAGK